MSIFQSLLRFFIFPLRFIYNRVTFIEKYNTRIFIEFINTIRHVAGFVSAETI